MNKLIAVKYTCFFLVLFRWKIVRSCCARPVTTTSSCTGTPWLGRAWTDTCSVCMSSLNTWARNLPSCSRSSANPGGYPPVRYVVKWYHLFHGSEKPFKTFEDLEFEVSFDALKTLKKGGICRRAWKRDELRLRSQPELLIIPYWCSLREIWFPTSLKLL